MTAGSLVTYLAHPEWADGIVLRVEANGFLLCEFTIDGNSYVDHFHAQELEGRQLAQAGR